MTAVEKQGDVARLLAQAQQAQVDLVVGDVAVGEGVAAAVVGHNRLVEPVRLVALPVTDLRAVPAVTQDYDIVRLRLVGQRVERGQNAVAGRLLVGQQPHAFGCKAEAIDQDALQKFGVVDTAVKLKPLREIGVLVDADEEGALALDRACLHDGPPSRMPYPVRTS